LDYLLYINPWIKGLNSDEYVSYLNRFLKKRKKRRIAYALCIVGGGLGFHRFYLGRYGTALMMLFLTIFTCGIAALAALFDLKNIERYIQDHDKEISLKIIKDIKRKEVL
jgi:TM2 domain-containing membrane protein YozV